MRRFFPSQSPSRKATPPTPGFVRQVSPSAFSLLELLVVIAIFAIMAAVTLPAFSSINQAEGVNRAGQTLGDTVILARQEAVSKNRDIEVRIIDVADPLFPGYRAIQLWINDAAGTNPSPLGKIQRLPDGVIIASNSLSPLLTADANVSGSTNFGALGKRDYRGFRIRANGALPQSVTPTNNFLTVQLAKDTGEPPGNFYAIRVNPVTGRVTTHRP